jgi:carbamoylphosphate synthase large subunit
VPKRTDIKSILIIGAGPIVIGQACEFDYSGAQACKALREEGYRVVLVNSNPATIMTDPDMADAVYIEPIAWPVVARIIERERPDALLPTMGGQTALNCALDLAREGVLEKFGVQMIGATRDAIDKAEDRERFREAMRRIGLATPRSALAHSMEEAIQVQAQIGFPTIIRPSFTMGGSGGGVAWNREEFVAICERGLDLSPTGELLIEESIIGWKEFEMEVVRDRNDNCIIVCSIENFDAMGVHTGDSITVAPAQTLTDREYQIMRDASLAVLREIGVETGGSNVQFAVNPADGRLVVIEMNPRVSRSSALASKATGFPIAKVAAKLAVGYTLDELKNEITGGVTPASFEPSIDYVVTKVPRFNFEKFPQADGTLTTQMKSVGEVMAIGRTFQESLQKALRGLETGIDGFTPCLADRDEEALEYLRRRLRTPSDDRLRYIGDAFRCGLSLDQVQTLTGIDPWFLDQVAEIIEVEAQIAAASFAAADAATLRAWKRLGFSDSRLAGAPAPAPTRRGAGLQACRLVRRRVSDRHRLHVLDLRGGLRVEPQRPAQGDDPRRRAEPHRSGHRVRLLLRTRGAGAARGGVRDHHGQLQPGDGVHRLRHRRPAVLRAADLRGRVRGLPGRIAVGSGRSRRDRGDRATRRADPAGSRAPAGGRRDSDRRHPPGGDRPRRGPWPLRSGADQRRFAGAEVRHRHQFRGSPRNRLRDRLSRAGAALLRARRSRHGDRLRREDPARLHHPGHPTLTRAPRAGGPLPRGRHRNRRRRPL